jgi:hypothetical protein
MKKPEPQPLDADMKRELDAIDAALAGDEISAAHEPLAQITVALREMRERPSEEFASTLDERAANRFARPRRRSAQARGRDLHARSGARSAPRPRGAAGALGHLSVGGARSLLLRPASGVALVALVAVAVVVPLLRSGGTHTTHPRPVSGPSVAQPAVATVGVGVATEQSARARQDLEAAPQAPSASSSGAAAPLAPTVAAPTRLIERTATLDVGVAPAAIQSHARQVFTLVSAAGGYVRQSSVSSGASHGREEPAAGDEGERGGASFDIRVPSANLASAIASLAHLGHVRSENDTTNDVTDRHTSLHGAFEEAQAERAGLVAKLRRASAEGEVKALKERLRAVDARIASLERQLRALDQRVTYTSLALSLTPETTAGASSGDLTPAGAARDAARILDAALAVLVLAAAAALPLALLLAGGWIAVALTRRRLREHALDAS